MLQIYSCKIQPFYNYKKDFQHHCSLKLNIYFVFQHFIYFPNSDHLGWNWVSAWNSPKRWSLLRKYVKISVLPFAEETRNLSNNRAFLSGYVQFWIKYIQIEVLPWSEKELLIFWAIFTSQYGNMLYHDITWS